MFRTSTVLYSELLFGWHRKPSNIFCEFSFALALQHGPIEYNSTVQYVLLSNTVYSTYLNLGALNVVHFVVLHVPVTTWWDGWTNSFSSETTVLLSRPQFLVHALSTTFANCISCAGKSLGTHFTIGHSWFRFTEISLRTRSGKIFWLL